LYSPINSQQTCILLRVNFIWSCWMDRNIHIQMHYTTQRNEKNCMKWRLNFIA